jgi:hypothetical protein
MEGLPTCTVAVGALALLELGAAGVVVAAVAGEPTLAVGAAVLDCCGALPVGAV